MMRAQTLREYKRTARKMDFHPSTTLVHALIDSHLDALARIEGLQRRVRDLQWELGNADAPETDTSYYVGAPDEGQ